jgi:hypothetical protein
MEKYEMGTAASQSVCTAWVEIWMLPSRFT